MKTPATITISQRFQGPPQSSNGGYICGRLAQYLETDTVEVNLKAPPPLDIPLKISKESKTELSLWQDEQIIAIAKAKTLEIKTPSPLSYEAAQEASKSYLGFRHHDYPECFVCGPERKPAEGLSIFAGPRKDQAGVAAPWVPDSSLSSDGSIVRPEFLWSALDCPGAFTFLTDQGPSCLLAQLTAQTKLALEVGKKYVVIAWPIAQEGRKYWVGSALFDSEGRCCGLAKGLWIGLKSN